MCSVEIHMNHQRLWDGRVKGIVVPSERALDTPLDLEIARFLKTKDYSHTRKLA